MNNLSSYEAGKDTGFGTWLDGGFIMGMVVRTNTMALNAYRQLGMNNNAVTKSLEKLSSGFRINRAGDDAAGLAISEKMKAQITGLETASANAQDGISLIQTAEGNLNEVHDMLNRMVELATKSANGTYTSTERDALQAEVDQLLDEIDRISKSANFNGAKLLDGSLAANNAIKAENIKSTDATNTSTIKGEDLGVAKTDADHVNPDGLATAKAPVFSVDLADYKVKLDDSGATASDVTFELAVEGKPITFYTAADFNKDTMVATSANEVDLKFSTNNSAGTTDIEKNGADIAGLVNGKAAVIGNDIYSVSANGSKLTFTYKGTVDTATGKITASDNNGDSVTENTWTPKGNLTITPTDTDSVIKETSGRDNCHITAITDPQEGGDAKRSGATLTLTQDIIDRGSLTIGDTTFTFDKTVAAGGAGTPTNAAPGATTGTVKIGIQGLEGDDLLKAVTEQMSHCTATITKKVDGTDTDFTFTVGRGADLKSIEIEENPATGTNKLGAFTEKELQDAFSQTVAATPAKVEITLSKDSNNEFVNVTAGNTLTIGNTSYKFSEDGTGTNEIKVGETAAETLENIKTKLGNAYNVTVDGANGKITIENTSAAADTPKVSYTARTPDNGGLVLQIGDTADDYNKMTVAVENMSSKGLDLDNLKITTESLASDAIDKIKTAINTVSTARAGMGALQNRLEHTINNLDVAVENLSAANSRIRDTDMAKEMMNYTKMNVLVQSAQAMLAQANQQPQSVLQLLQ